MASVGSVTLSAASDKKPSGSGAVDRNPSRAAVAHVLRRLTFGPAPGLVERLMTNTIDGPTGPTEAAGAAVDHASTRKPRSISPGKANRDDYEPYLRGWVANILHPDAGLHEKMTWFWHSHFATSSEKVSNPVLLHSQQQLFRRHALGKFPDLFRAILTDPAMLLYLDGSGSNVDGPNENLSRESMELFALGAGQYTEADVKAGSLVLAGWEVNYETGAVKFHPERALGGEVILLGRRGRLGVDEFADILSSHRSCATHLTRKIYAYLVGTTPTPQRLASLSDRFRASGLDAAVLVREITSGSDFISARMTRPRYPIEWWSAAVHAIGHFRADQDPDLSPWILEQLDQIPHKPPNVAGWPPGPKWLSSSQQLTRMAYIWSLSARMEPIEPENRTDLVSTVLQRCDLHEITPETRRALQDAALATGGSADALSVSRRLVTTAICSPEFAMA